MPFISQAYLRYLESQMGGGAQSTLDPGPDAPPPADMVEPPTTAPFGPPGQGGPGSYPAPSPTGPIGPPIAQPPYQSNIPPNPFGGTPISNPPGGDNPPIPNPPSTIAGGGVGPGQLANPPSVLPGQPTPPAPAPAPPTQPGGNAPPAPPGTQPAGVDLSINDRINMILHSMGLPPLPTGYSPFGGLPSGMVENPNIGGGAPLFSFADPTLNTGPQWNAGGSIYGGRGLPITPGTYVGAVGGSPSPINIGALPNSWLNDMGMRIAASQYQGPLSQAQYIALMQAAMAANSAAQGGADYIPGGGSQFRGTPPTSTR